MKFRSYTEYAFVPPQWADFTVHSNFASGRYPHEANFGHCKLSYWARIPDDDSWHFYYEKMDSALIEHCARCLLTQETGFLKP